MNKDSKIIVLGSNGLVGSALLRSLKVAGHTDLRYPTRDIVDLTDREATLKYFLEHQPEYVFLAAAKVAGIQGNMRQPVQMLMANLEIQNSVIWAAHHVKVKKLMFFGSSCIYPKYCPQPIKEEYLLTSPLEPSNEPYALAKIAGLKLCQAFRQQYNDNFISVMPTNLFGLNDTYRPGCHVIPDLIRKFYHAKVTGQPKVPVWGDGTARREFLYSDDLARACIAVMEKYDSPEPINIGYGTDVTIRELAEAVADTVGLERDRLTFDPKGVVGTPVKLLDSSKVFALGWKPLVSLGVGLRIAYADFMKNHAAKQ
jgi:GDP-L-fucose synthase